MAMVPPVDGGLGVAGAVAAVPVLSARATLPRAAFGVGAALEIVILGSGRWLTLPGGACVAVAGPPRRRDTDAAGDGGPGRGPGPPRPGR